MNSLLNSQNINPIEVGRAYQKIADKTLKELFKNKINGSFLIKIKSEVFNKTGLDLLKYYPMNFDNTKIITGRDETPEYDICRIIIGVHKHNSIFLTKEEIRKNEKDTNYQEKLVNEVIEKIRFRQFGSSFFRRKQLFLGDEFLYFSVPYELFVMSLRAICLMTGNANPLFIYYGDIINNALSSLTLMENNFLNNAYPLCRGMIELYLKTLILQKHPEIRNNYSKFCDFEIEQSCCSQKYPDEFIELYENRRFNIIKSKVDYLHYGWLDNIANYDTKIPNKYSIYGILDYLMDNADDEQYQALVHIERLYKMCHGYTHGSVIHVKYPLLQYFEISTMLYYVLKNIFTDIHKKLEVEILPEDKELLDMLDRDFKILDKQYESRSTEKFETYCNIFQ